MTVDLERDLKDALRAEADPVWPGFEARAAAGVHARWRRRTRRARVLAATGVCAVLVLLLGARAHFRGGEGASALPAPAPARVETSAALPVPSAEELADELADLADVDDALSLRANWEEATAPLDAYRELASLEELQ
jgi:hypothetical protein